MNCYICGGPLGDPKLDNVDRKIRPCLVCDEVVSETIRGYDQQDTLVEDIMEPLENFLEYS